MPTDSLEKKVLRLCRETFGKVGQLQELVRLSGGANMESWALRYADRSMVLRRLPGGSRETVDGDDHLGAISLAAQAELIESAGRGGVTVPDVLARLEPRHGLGEGFIMSRVEGETLPHRILGQPSFAQAEAQLTQQCARELARIHALDPASVPEELRYLTPLELVREQAAKYRDTGALLPVFDFTLRWLQQNAPTPTPPAVLHGDFRMGNLMIDASGITAVLDWELAHLGDPARDLAYLCAPSWRFGHYDKPVGGFDQIDALLQAYREQSGRDIEPARLRYWLVFSTLWWGIVCLVMGELWRSGGDRSLERAVIGRRVSEVEADLLLLFEEILGLGGGNGVSWEPPSEHDFAGEIDYAELLTALGEWNRESVQAVASGHQLFESRVAGNALGIARRHARWAGVFDQASRERLREIGLDHASLCQALAKGSVGLDDNALWDHLRLSALERMTIDQPRYAGLQQARQRWCK